MSTTAIVAITGAVTTLGVAAGGWYFNWMHAKLAQSESRATRHFEMRRDVYVSVLRSCLDYWTYLVHLDMFAKGGAPVEETGLPSEAERSGMLAEMYASGTPDVVAAAEAFWLQARDYNSAAITALTVRGADGPGNHLQDALETMEAERQTALRSLGVLERLVGQELRAL